MGNLPELPPLPSYGLQSESGRFGFTADQLQAYAREYGRLVQEAANLDAARYRWLKKNAAHAICAAAYSTGPEACRHATPDEAIDAAIRAPRVDKVAAIRARNDALVNKIRWTEKKLQAAKLTNNGTTTVHVVGPAGEKREIAPGDSVTVPGNWLKL